MRSLVQRNKGDLIGHMDIDRGPAGEGPSVQVPFLMQTKSFFRSALHTMHKIISLILPEAIHLVYIYNQHLNDPVGLPGGEIY